MSSGAGLEYTVSPVHTSPKGKWLRSILILVTCIVPAALLAVDPPGANPVHAGAAGELHIDRILRCGPQEVFYCDDFTVVKVRPDPPFLVMP